MEARLGRFSNPLRISKWTIRPTITGSLVFNLMIENHWLPTTLPILDHCPFQILPFYALLQARFSAQGVLLIHLTVPDSLDMIQGGITTPLRLPGFLFPRFSGPGDSLYPAS